MKLLFFLNRYPVIFVSFLVLFSKRKSLCNFLSIKSHKMSTFFKLVATGDLDTGLGLDVRP